MYLFFWHFSLIIFYLMIFFCSLTPLPVRVPSLLSRSLNLPAALPRHIMRIYSFWRRLALFRVAQRLSCGLRRSHFRG